MRDNARKIRDFFLKPVSPCLQTSSIPPWETLKCLLQTLQYACCLPRSLTITQSNVLVYSALKFDPLRYHIRFFAWLIPGDDSRSAFFVGFIKLYSRLEYLYLYYSVYIQALNWYQFFSDFEMLYLTAIRNYQASLRYQYWSLSQTGSSRWGIVRSREHAILIFLGEFRQIITRNGF